MVEALIDTYIAEPANDRFVELLTVDKLQHHWPKIAKELDRVPHIWADLWTKDYLLNASISGNIQIWAVGSADDIRLVVFTQVLYYPAATVLEVFITLGNDLRGCLPVLKATLYRYAQARGCKMANVVGREGWGKLLPGARKSATTFTVTIEKMGAH